MATRKTAASAVPSRRPVRLMAILCALMLAAGTLPLYAIAFDNHPYYDDYNFSTAVHDTWRETRSLTAVLSAAWQSARGVRDTWQGTYTGRCSATFSRSLFRRSLLDHDLFPADGFPAVLRLFLPYGVPPFAGRRPGRDRVRLLPRPVPFDPVPARRGRGVLLVQRGVGNTFIYSLIALAAALSCACTGRNETASGWRPRCSCLQRCWAAAATAAGCSGC
jgi:hypothetical protein